MARVALVNKDSGAEPVLYMAMELSNKQWKLVYGVGVKRRHVSVEAGHRVAAACGAAALEVEASPPRPDPETQPVRTGDAAISRVIVPRSFWSPVRVRA